MRGLFLLLAGLCCAGCGGRGIATYEVPKEEVSREEPVELRGGGDNPAPSAVGGLAWEAPGGWTEGAAKPMRLTTYQAGDDKALDISVAAFPGDVGGLLANVNRWRGQIGLGPVDEAGLRGSVEAREFNGLAGTRVRLRGAEQSILAALVEHGGQTWFFKMQGPEASVEREEARFGEWMGTLRAGP